MTRPSGFAQGSSRIVARSPVTGFSQTYLYDPKVHGNSVRSIVFGYVQTSLGSSSFMLQQLFTVG